MPQIIPSSVRISAQDWLTRPETQRVMAVLGHENARFVGGCVRNAVLGEPVSDVDIATLLPPETVMHVMAESGILCLPTGLSHGTVMAVLHGLSYEITTLRQDLETDGRHAVVAYTQDWVADAQRRDFTMNTLLADHEGQVYDPLGAGLADLEAHRVVFVGDSALRIAEDALRILRYFRFYGRYGAGAPDKSALVACRNAALSLECLSRERISQEFFKILMGPRVVEILALMCAHDVLPVFRFKAYQPDVLDRLCALQDTYGAGALSARIGVLSGWQQDNLGTLETRCVLPNKLKAEISALQNILAGELPVTESAQRRALYRAGRETTLQGFLIAMAQGPVVGQEAHIGAWLEKIRTQDIPVFPVTGEDLLKAGYTTGPALGAKLKALEAEWLQTL